ncbi:MAG: M23 family peptidase, partial [Methylophilaceae bacterium]
MKLLLISKNNTRKPLAIDFRVFILLLALLFSVISLSVFYYLTARINNDHEGTIENLKLDLGFSSYQKSLQLYVQQIGEINARVEELDNQTERL